MMIVEVDTLEQNINDEMVNVLVLAPTDMEFDEPEMESPTVEMSVDMEMLIWKCSLNLHLQRWIRRNIYK